MRTTPSTTADRSSAHRPTADRLSADGPSRQAPRPLYTPEQHLRRDRSRWTLVQGILAPVQFAVFAVSLVLVLHALLSGRFVGAAEASVLVKTLALYAIMVTGSLWEHDIYGRYLFAPAFFWEDAVSMLVLALHTAYVVALATGALDAGPMLLLALVAYASYLGNAGQFLLKLRAARRCAPAPIGASTEALAA